MVGWEAIVTQIIIVAMLASMVKEIAPPDMIMMGALVLFLPLQIISIEEVVALLDPRSRFPGSARFLQYRDADCGGVVYCSHWR